MQEFILETRDGGPIVVLLCMLLLLSALLCLFRDRDIRIIGYLTIAIFGATLIGTLITLAVLDIEIPTHLGLIGRHRWGGTILLLWAWGSYKLADWLYHRYFSS